MLDFTNQIGVELMDKQTLTIKQYFKVNYGDPVFLPVNYHRFKLKTGVVSGPITAHNSQKVILMDKAIKITDKAIAKLPEPLKTIAILRYTQGQKVNEVAATINYSRSRYYQLAKKTREQLAERINRINQNERGPLPLITPA